MIIYQGVRIWGRIFSDIPKQLSAMLLELNGKSSSEIITCHMNLRYFFVKGGN